MITILIHNICMYELCISKYKIYLLTIRVLEGQFMLYQLKPNNYKIVIEVDATPNQDCPEPECEQWLKGLYMLDICK